MSSSNTMCGVLAVIAAKSAPDGYNLVLVFDTHGVNPSLIPNMPFDTVKDLAPIMLIGTSPMVITAHPSTPYKSFGDLVSASKAKPGSVAYGTIGAGSLAQLAMTQFGNQLKVEFTHVPYKGGASGINDLISGQVQLMMESTNSITPFAKAGRVRGLAVSGPKRSAALPDLPTIAEAIHERRAHISALRARDVIGALVPDPPLAVNCPRLLVRVRTVEENNAVPPRAFGQQALEVKLRLPRFGEDDGFLSRAELGRLIERDAQRFQQGFTLGVRRDRVGEVTEPFEVGDFACKRLAVGLG